MIRGHGGDGICRNGDGLCFNGKKYADCSDSTTFTRVEVDDYR